MTKDDCSFDWVDRQLSYSSPAHELRDLLRVLAGMFARATCCLHQLTITEERKNFQERRQVQGKRKNL